MFYLTETERLKAIAICNQIETSIAKLNEQMASAKKATDDFLADLAAQQAERKRETPCP